MRSVPFLVHADGAREDVAVVALPCALDGGEQQGRGVIGVRPVRSAGRAAETGLERGERLVRALARRGMLTFEPGAGSGPAK